MDWFASVRKQAQEAVNTVVNSEAAGLARQLAAQATEQATALAKEAKVKAQEVAKEAIGEAEKSLKNLQQGSKQQPAAASADPLQYGITPELGQFVRSLTYSTFSDYPLDSLDIPAAAADQKLSSWQETHARLLLQQVPQLQDLRFVLCPKRMDEYVFWTIYFTLCKRYLPVQRHEEQPEQPQAQQQQQQQQQEALARSSSSTSSSQQAAGAAAAAGGGSVLPLSSSAANLLHEAETQQEAAAAADHQAAADPAAAAAAAAGGGSAAAAGRVSSEGGLDEDELAALADDPELDAYLQDALQLDGDAAAGGSMGEADGSELEDLDDYINKLDAEVSAK
uniref:BSD domain-containing protein n=1 Tax=Tetradesmus obliquus TaxID=3088 RepID=A0A383W225_TETOB|eukprot:jgi/Sobl393_1/483/SZX71270.1